MISDDGDNLVFLLGIPRSGTTLLSVMLDGHPQVRCPPEPWLMLALEAVGRVPARHPADAPVLYRAMKRFADPETAAAAARSYAAVAYNRALAGTGKAVLVDKTPRYHLILDYLVHVFPRARFVILWRNPLDVAASIRTNWQVDLPSLLAAGEDHLACIDLVVGLRRLVAFAKAHGDRVHALQYERLVRDPQPTFDGLVRWLGLPPEPLADFDLAGGPFDHGEVGDKKILSTRSPHANSIGRWADVFDDGQVDVLTRSIGPHLFAALGYDAVRAGDADPARSNAYAQRLENSLLARHGEYESVETFSDLAAQERRLHRALSGSTPPPDRPVAVDLATEFRVAADAAGELSAASRQSLVRIGDLERAAAAAAGQLDEARSLSRAQLDHAAARESDRAAERAELKRRADQERSAEVAALTQQLEQKQAALAETIGDLRGHRQEVVRLDLRVREVEARLRTTADEVAQRRAGEAELSHRLRAAEERLAVPPNRRPWPFVVPDAPPLPATLPGGRAWPRISVVTPSFNHGHYVEQTVLSVLGQRYPNLEYIFVDGGSTDQTMAVVGRYADRIDHLVSEPDGGQSDAINKGFARATGDLLAWVNSDDMLEPGALAAMAMAFHTSSADVVAGVCTLHADGAVVGRHMTACPPGSLPVDDLLDLDRCWLRGRFFYQPEVMFTRDLWDRAGGRVDVGLYYSMDYDLWLRFAEQGARLHVIGRPTAIYRVHAGQKTFSMAAYRPELTVVRDRFCRRTGRAAPPATVGGPGRSHLRVVFFNDLGNAGGAGIAHQRLAAAVASAGHVVAPVAIRPALCRSELPNDAVLQAIADRTPDVVVVGNTHSARLDPALPGLIARRWPTLQVLHDLYALTGRCAYPGECRKFVAGCDATCPTAGEYPPLDPPLIAGAWAVKDDTLRGGRPPVLAAVSRWTEEMARLRFSGDAADRRPPIVPIRYGLSTDVFRPRDRSTCRDLMGLPQDRFIVLFSSSDLADRRKGLAHLIEALASLALPDLLAVCVGSDNADLADGGVETRGMGYVVDERSLAMLYAAADVFVGPSLVETFGQVFIEAAACGVPSVGYATAGGVAEAIADGVSGFLAPTQSPAELAAVIGRLYADPDLRRDLGAWGRLWAENEFSFRSSHQRLFAGLHGLGLIDRLDVAPNVRFTAGPTTPEPIAYLDVPPPPPTADELMLRAAREQIAALHAEQDRLAALSRAALADAEAAHERREAQSQTERAALEAERELLRSERDHREALIGEMAQTRTWRLVRAVYPLYQKTVGRLRPGKGTRDPS